MNIKYKARQNKVLSDKSSYFKKQHQFVNINSEPTTTARLQKYYSSSPEKPSSVNRQVLARTQNMDMDIPEPQATELEMNNVFGTENLVYQSDDMQVYSVSADIDIDQLRSMSGGSEEFTQRHDWRLVRQLESMGKDLVNTTSARLEVLEDKLAHWNDFVLRLQAAEEKLAQNEDIFSGFQTAEEAMLEIRSKLVDRYYTIEDLLDKQAEINELLNAVQDRLKVQEELALSFRAIGAKLKQNEELSAHLEALEQRIKQMTETLPQFQQTEIRLQRIEGSLDYINGEVKILKEEGVTEARLNILEERLEQENKIIDRLEAAEAKIILLDTWATHVQNDNKKPGLEDTPINLEDVKAKLQKLEDFCNYLYALVHANNVLQDPNTITDRTRET